MEWNDNRQDFCARSKQPFYGGKLAKEADKVQYLHMPTTCYTEEGLVALGIGKTTTSVMSKLLDKEYMWTPPDNTDNALCLSLWKHGMP